jgi:hypothetical protein
LPNAAENLVKLQEICDASAKKALQLAQVGLCLTIDWYMCAFMVERNQAHSITYWDDA